MIRLGEHGQGSGKSMVVCVGVWGKSLGKRQTGMHMFVVCTTT